MTKFYAIGYPAVVDGQPGVATGELALGREQTAENIRYALEPYNLPTTENVEATQGPITVYELVPVGGLRDAVLE